MTKWKPTFRPAARFFSRESLEEKKKEIGANDGRRNANAPRHAQVEEGGLCLTKVSKGLTAIRTRDLLICSQPPYHLATNPFDMLDANLD